LLATNTHEVPNSSKSRADARKTFGTVFVDKRKLLRALTIGLQEVLGDENDAQKLATES
jgi:predicted membrane chloride channel (bestrophin family)